MTATITRVRVPGTGARVDIVHENEPDRASITANGIVVDVIANDDGTVYVETYPANAKAGTAQVVVQHAAIDAYTVRHPNFKLGLTARQEA
jgi:hypothetical protein